MRVFNKAKLVGNDKILMGEESYPCKVGKHCIWIPQLEIKLVLSLNGRIESNEWHLGKNKGSIEKKEFGVKDMTETMNSIINEHKIFSVLSERRMSPQVKEYVEVGPFTSNIFYKNYCDEMGLRGYEIVNANKLPKGKWNFDRFKSEFIDTGVMIASPGALGDLKKEDNVVNGYLIDCRRSIFDMISIVT